MPSEVVTIVSTGIAGVSVFVGVLSCFVYLFTASPSRKRVRNLDFAWYCGVCGNYLQSRKCASLVTCRDCKKRVCKGRCSKRNYTLKEWLCYNCLKRKSWLRSTFNEIFISYKTLHLKNIFSQKSNQMKKGLPNADDRSLKQGKQHVRDFIEKLVSSILGTNVDDACVFWSSDNQQYDVLFDKYHQDLSDAISTLSYSLQTSKGHSSLEYSSLAHSNLRFIIQKILHEVSNLTSGHNDLNQASAINEEERTYENLLATAILNKIISKKVEAPFPEIEDVFQKDYEIRETRSQDESTSSQSSDSPVEPDEVDSSDSTHRRFYSIHQYDGKSFSNQLHINTESDFYINHENSPPCLTDGYNWHLQRRNNYASHSPIQVPMVVPYPTTSAKVFIGDKEVEETSDLSDVDSEDPLDVVINSTVVIQDATSTDNHVDEETSFSSGFLENEDDDEVRTEYEESKNNKNVDTRTNLEDEALISSLEQNAEYLEESASLPKKRFGRDYYTKQAASPSGKRAEGAETNWAGSNGNLYNPDLPSPQYMQDQEESEDEVNVQLSIDVNQNLETTIHDDSRMDNNTIFTSIHAHYESKPPPVRYIMCNEKEAVDPSLMENEVAQDVAVESVKPQLYEPKIDNRNKTSNSLEKDKDTTVNLSPTPRPLNKQATSPFMNGSPVISPNKGFIFKNEEDENRDNNNGFRSVYRKPDNTLIKKIYADPVVRSFALKNRETLPYTPEEQQQKTETPYKVQVVNAEQKSQRIYQPVVKSEKHDLPYQRQISKPEPLNSQFSLEYSDSETSTKEHSAEAENENDIEELKEKRLVASLLSRWTKSYPNLHSRGSPKSPLYKKVGQGMRNSESEEEPAACVKDLRKKFEGNDVAYKNKPVHSITARSVAKEIKDELKGGHRPSSNGSRDDFDFS